MTNQEALNYVNDNFGTNYLEELAMVDYDGVMYLSCDAGTIVIILSDEGMELCGDVDLSEEEEYDYYAAEYLHDFNVAMEFVWFMFQAGYTETIYYGIPEFLYEVN